LNFDGTKTKVGTLELELSKETIEVAIEIPNIGERWFKSMNINANIAPSPLPMTICEITI
jgi:hypothetical protein